MPDHPFVPVPGQSFSNHAEWVRRAPRLLTAHREYRNTEHGGEKGWRGHHFTALCFDQLGRRCRMGADFQRAEAEGAFPVWWIWPDQIAPLLMQAGALGRSMRPISEAPRDGTPVLVKIKDDLSPWGFEPGREGTDRFEGLHAVMLYRGRHLDWCFAAPVGHGGFSDQWLDGWWPLPVEKEASA